MIAVLCLAGCATVRKVETGSHQVGERLSISIDGAWNHLDFPGIKPAQVWTMEGIPIDELMIYSAIEDGVVMHDDSGGSDRKDIVFRSSMQIEEMVSMFESVLTRDGSTFKLTKVEPSLFGGKKGFHFEYERIRRVDGLRQLGFGYGAVDKGQLFALIYHAPRLTFFPRYKDQVEDIARAVVIR